jgi:CBS domain-containing protein
VIVGILLGIGTGLLANELCEFSPWCARKLVHWSAFRRYTDPGRAEMRAEELTALINDRPGNLFKLITAVCFAADAVIVCGRRALAREPDNDRGLNPALPVLSRRLARKAISVAADTPLAEAIRRADESQAGAVVIVDHDDRPITILNETAVMATPLHRRPWIEAVALARMLEPSLVLPADLSGMALLDAIRRAPASEYLLVEPSGQVCGVLAARDVDRAFAGV